jgi:hypothetical protein
MSNVLDFPNDKNENAEIEKPAQSPRRDKIRKRRNLTIT